MKNETRVTSKLSQGFKNDSEMLEISDALTRAIADYYDEVSDKLDRYSAYYYDPATAKEEWLDKIAEFSAWGDLWESSWNVESKRKLLINSDYIWSNRGQKAIAIFLFNIFNLEVSIESSEGFILNQSLFPEDLSYSPFSYNVIISNSYENKSSEFLLIKKILNIFLPCWIDLQIIRT